MFDLIKNNSKLEKTFFGTLYHKNEIALIFYPFLLESFIFDSCIDYF